MGRMDLQEHETVIKDSKLTHKKRIKPIKSGKILDVDLLIHLIRKPKLVRTAFDPEEQSKEDRRNNDGSSNRGIICYTKIKFPKLL